MTRRIDHPGATAERIVGVGDALVGRINAYRCPVQDVVGPGGRAGRVGHGQAVADRIVGEGVDNAGGTGVEGDPADWASVHGRRLCQRRSTQSRLAAPVE